MKKIKVLMFGWEYPPYISGGLGTHCYYLTKALAKLGVKIYFITPHPIHKKRGKLEIIGLGMRENFKKDRKMSIYALFKRKVDLYSKKAVRILQKLNFDLIHCHDWMSIDAGIALKDITKKPMILTMHSTGFDRLKKPRKTTVNIEKRGLEAANKIIAVSNYTKKIICKKYGISKRKVFVIYNAVKQKKINLKKKRGKTKYILYLGRLKYQKGIPYLIKAAAKVVKLLNSKNSKGFENLNFQNKEKNVRFLILGKGSKIYKNQLKQQVMQLGLKNYFTFLRYTNNKDYYYKKAYLVVMPSVSEPFGIVPLEAISNGTPTIISKQSGVAEVLKSCLKVNYWDTNDLAKKIILLLRNKQAHEKLRRNGLKEVKKFTWEKIARETLNLYTKVLESNKN